MKSTLCLFLILFCCKSFAYKDDLKEIALEEYNKKCQASFTVQDIEEVVEVDADYDYSAQLVSFKNGGEVYITMTRDQADPNGRLIYFLDEVYCQ